MSAHWLKLECTLIRPTPGTDRIGSSHAPDSKRLHKTIQLNQLDACQTDAGSGRLTIAMLRLYCLYCCVFECRDIAFTCPPSPSSPPWLFVHWLGCFSPLCVSGPQPRWSSPGCLWSSRQAQRPVWLDTPTLTLRWDGGRAAAWWDRRRKRKGGVGGLVADTLSCPELLRVCVAYCPAAPSFLYPSPTLSSPCCSPIQQIGSGGPDVDILLQALHMNL